MLAAAIFRSRDRPCLLPGRARPVSSVEKAAQKNVPIALVFVPIRHDFAGTDDYDGTMKAATRSS
jgi:hypothetical protein